MFQYQTAEFREFHGGITENIIDARPHQYEEADNLLITENRKLHTRPGSTIYDTDKPQIPAGAQRISHLIDHYDELLVQSAKKVYYENGVSWDTLQGPTGNDVLTTGDTASRVFSTDWNKHTFMGNDDYAPVMKIYKDGGNTWQARTAGLPKLANSPTVTKGGTTSGNNYIYTFCYAYTYTVGTVTFLDLGAITTVQITDATAPDASTVAITNIPVISNGSTYNWDTTNIKVRIYRTKVNGTTSNLVAEVTNGTTIYNDSTSDTTLEGNTSLYTDSGLLSADPTPLCRAMHVTRGIGLYGNIKTASGEIISNRVRQSIPDDIDSCPESMFVDLDDDVVAISSVGRTPVVLCKDSVYRLDGLFDGKGGGLLEAQEIESTVGCVSMTSVVQVQRGVVFASKSGFYFTDGYEVRKLSSSFNTRYSKLVLTDAQAEKIHGCFDEINKRVYWSVQEEGESEVNKHYILDTRYGLGVAGDDLENVTTAFTTASNGVDYYPTACLFLNDVLLRADSRGYIFKHGTEYLSDPDIDTAAAFSTWPTKAIIWNFKSAATSFGTTYARKYVPRMVINAENGSNISIDVVSINDLGRQSKSVKPLVHRKNWTWGDPLLTWGDADEIWDFKGMVAQVRRFHGQHLRCFYKQVQFTNALVNIATSEDMTTVVIDAVAKTATFTDIASHDWIDDAQGYSLYLENDSYIQDYLITNRTDDVLTLSDPLGKLKNGTYKWLIKGYPKDEVLNLISYTLVFAMLGRPEYFDSASVKGDPA